MRKSDLRSGMVIELRNGLRYLLVDFNGKLNGIRDEGWHFIYGYREDMTYSKTSEFDVVKVWKPTPRSLEGIKELSDEEAVWIREETREITAEEAFRALREFFGGPVSITEEL